MLASKGFILIEFLLVIAILAVLSTVAITEYNKLQHTKEVVVLKAK